jgi:glycerol-3-phosphate cytidylyltransferase
MKEKIIEREKAVAIKTALSAEGKKVGFTSGVFDIVHAGHVEYLEYAKSLVDILFVGINSDASVKQNKGDARPINSERLRAEVIAGLQAVDYVFVFGERNNNINTEMLAPDVYIKAGDYSPERLSSKDIVERHGGRIELVPFKQGLSTTSVIEKIQLAAVSEDGEKISYSNRPADLSIDVRKSFVIGDMTSDIKFGLDAGAQTVLVKTGRGGEDGMFSVVPHHTAKDLLEAAEIIAGLVG